MAPKLRPQPFSGGTPKIGPASSSVRSGGKSASSRTSSLGEGPKEVAAAANPPPPGDNGAQVPEGEHVDNHVAGEAAAREEEAVRPPCTY